MLTRLPAAYLRTFCWLALSCWLALLVPQQSHAQLYYALSDGSNNTNLDQLRRTPLAGGPEQTVVGSGTSSYPTNPSQLAYDQATNRLFVVQAFNNATSIAVVDLGTFTVSTFLTPASISGAAGNLVTGLAVAGSYLYYDISDGSNSTTQDQLRRIALAGGAEQIVVNSGTPSFPANPGVLTVDQANNRLFVANTFNGQQAIAAVNLTNFAVTTFLNPAATGGPGTTVTGLAVAGSYLYYGLSDGSNTSSQDQLRRISLTGGTEQTVVAAASSPNYPTNPTTLAYDQANNRLFVDQSFNNATRIAAVDLATFTVTTFLTPASISGAAGNNITGLAVVAPATAPTVTTTSPGSIMSTSAVLGGNVTADGGASVTGRGEVYSASNTSPTVGGSGTTTAPNGSGTGTFSATASSLTPGTTYYVQAYATNSVGTSYGGVQMFTTAANTPTVSTLTAGSPTTSSAVLGGNVTADGGATVTGRGVVYSAGNPTPVVGGSSTTTVPNGSGTGSFSATVTGLASSTTYYVQAYATNNAGTSYGGVQTFTTTQATAQVTAVTGQTPSPTATAQVSYAVTFSPVVSGVTSANFSLTTTGLSGASIASVSPATGASATYTVVVNTGTGDGTLRLNVNNSTGVTPTLTNVPYTSGTTYTLTKSFAAAPTLRIQGAGSASSNADVTAFVDAVQVLQSGTSTAVVNGLQNGSFETNNVAAGSYLYQSQGVVAAPWSFGPQAGVSRNNSAFGSTAADGDAVAFLQSTGGNNGNVTQNLAVPTGSYQVRFRGLQRNYTSLDQRLNVFVNDVFVGSIQPNNIPTYDTFTSAPFSVTAPALTATVNTTSSSPTSTTPIPFSVSFSQSVGISFAASDVTVTNGTVTSGSFSGSGSGPYTFTVTPSGGGTVTVSVAAGVASDANNTGNTASNAVSVQYTPAVLISPPSLPNGTVAVAYSQTLTASGGTAPYSYAITAGALPAGLTLTSSGSLSGTPTAGGSFTFAVTATDASTGSGPYAGSRNYTLTIATQPVTAAPVVTAPANGSIVAATTPVYSGTAPANSVVTVYVDGTALSGTVTADGSGNWSKAQPTALGQGSHTVYATAQSSGSAVSARSNTNTFTVDTVAPAAPVVTAPANGSAIATTTPTYSGTAEANSVVTVYVDGVALSGAVLANGSGNWSKAQPTALSQGSHTVYVTATDAAGNTSANSATNTFTVNTVAPTVAISSSAGASGGSTSTSPIPFTVTFSKAVTGFVQGDLTVTGGTVSGFSGSGATYTFNVTPSSSSSTVAVNIAANVAQDAAGNGNTAAAPFSLTYQQQVVATSRTVTVQLDASGNGTLQANSGTTGVNNGSTGAGTLTYTIQKIAYGRVPENSTLTLNTSNGANFTAIRFASYGTPSDDGNGNYRLGSCNANGQNGTASSVAKAQNAFVGQSSGSLLASNNYSDGSTNFGDPCSGTPKYLAVQAAYSADAASLPYTCTEAGKTQYVLLTVTDANGNSSTAVARVIVTAPPVASITGVSPSAAPRGAMVTVTGTNLGGIGSTVTVNNATAAVSNLTNTSGSTYTFTFVVPTMAASGVGNLAVTAPCSQAASIAFTVQQTQTAAPTLISPANGATTNGLPTLAGTAAPTASVLLYLNGTALPAVTADGSGNFTTQPSSALPSGSYSVYATAQLSGQAVSSASPTVIFTVDNTQPVPTVSSTSPSPTSTAPIPFRVTFSEAVTGFTASSLTVANGTVASFAGSGTTYDLTIAPGGAGAVTVSVQASSGAVDAVGNPNAASNSVSVQYQFPAITVAPPTLPNGTVGVVYSQTFTAAGGSGSYSYALVAGAGALPAGLTLANNGTLAGTPTAGGTFSFAVRATDTSTGATGQQNYSLGINAPTVAVAPATLPDGQVGAAYAQSLVATGGTAPYTFALVAGTGTLPAGLTLASNGTLAGTPTQSGSFGFTVRATDASTGSGPYSGARAYTLTIGVQPVTAAPVVTAPANNSTLNTATPTYAGTAPAGSTVTVLVDGTSLGTTVATAGGAFSLAQPTALAQGSHTVQATAQRSGSAVSPSSGTVGFTIDTVAPSVVVSSSAGTSGGSTGSSPIPFTVTFSEAVTGFSASSVTVSGGSLTAGSFSGSGTTYAFTVTPAGIGSTVTVNVGQNVAQDQAGNGNTASPAAYSLRFAPALTATVSTTSASPTSTAPISFAVSFSQSVGASFTTADVTVTGGTITSGSFSGSGSGPYTFTVTPSGSTSTITASLVAGVASDAANTGNQASNAVSVQFQAPTITVSPATLPGGTVAVAYTQTLTAAGGTAPYTFAITAGALPAGLTLTSAGTLSGTPTVSGTYNFRLTATDNSAAPGPYSGLRDYTVTIAAPAVTAVSWTGTVSTDWYTAGNWSPSQVPDATIDATIPTAPSGNRFPAIGSGTATARNLTLNSGATLVQTGGTLVVAANLTNNGSFQPVGGTVALGSSALSNLLGSGPTRFWNLTVGSSGAQQSSSASISVQRQLTLNGGFATNGNPFTLESSAAGTALVVNSGNSVVTGDVTVQRYLDPTLNPGLGYRHYAAPVRTATVVSLTTASYTPVVNPAYNTSATPARERPFPTVLGYDQARLASTSNDLDLFTKGWYSPASLGDALAVGQGYALNLSAGQALSVRGSLNNGDLFQTLQRNSGPTAADAGLALVGNPYPAPLDWSQVTASDRPGLDGVLYVFQSTSQYGGQYRSYVNGVGDPVVAQGQGFFVRVTPGQTNGQLTFRNAQRLTTYQNPALQRTAAETRPLVQLTLQGVGTPYQDAATVYFQAGASQGLDAEFDAPKLANSTGLNLSTSLAPGQPLSIDGRPVLGPAQLVVPLAVGVPAAGSYSLTAAQLLNLRTTPTYLRDVQTGAVVDLAQQPTYQFTVSNASSLLTGRFELVFSPQQALAASSAALAQQVALYPNPAAGTAYVELPASLGRQAVSAVLVDAVGRQVRALALPAQGAVAHQLDLHELPTGIYTLHLRTSAGTLVKKLTVE